MKTFLMIDRKDGRLQIDGYMDRGLINGRYFIWT